MKKLMIALCLSLLAACATVAPKAKKPAEPELVGALVITVDGKPEEVVFLESNGQVVELTVEKCRSIPECPELIKALSEQGQVDVIDVPGAARTKT